MAKHGTYYDPNIGRSCRIVLRTSPNTLASPITTKRGLPSWRRVYKLYWQLPMAALV
jgi:hypothetical protein